MAKNAAKIMLVAVVIAGLILPFLKTGAAEKTEALKEVNEIVDDLINLKDDDNLSKEEKNSQEISVRKEALEKIIDLSLAEIQDLRQKLEALELADKSQKETKSSFLESLKNFEEYYNGLRAELDKDQTIDSLKDLAKELKSWRAKEYIAKTQFILSFTLIHNEKLVLKIADERLDKINSDIKKLENAKMIKKNSFNSEFASAMKSLAAAHLLNSNAEKIFSKSLEEIILASSTASSSAVSIDGSEATTTIATSTKKSLSPEIEIKQLIEKSLKEIKNAYNNFLSISKAVKKKLGL